jgi:hypothetical protein
MLNRYSEQKRPVVAHGQHKGLDDRAESSQQRASGESDK